jgi:flagellar hook-associated protein 3 FlgL
MKVSVTSDLGRLTAMQARARDTREAQSRAATEMTTGETASRYDATAGNTTRIFAIERLLDRNAVFSQTIALTEIRLDTMQNGLGLILEPLQDLAIDLPSSVGLGDVAASELHAETARNAFRDSVSVLNGQAGGLSLYAGTATDSPALADADTLLGALDALAQAAASPADAIAAIDDYFRKAPPGAFYGSGYTGSPDDSSPVDIGEGRRLDYAVRADDDRLVAVLRSQALAAVVAGGAFAGDDAARMQLLEAAGAAMLSAKEGLLDLRAAVGVSQQALETGKAARVAEQDTLDLARNAILSVDPSEAAAQYQALETQLDTIYTVTARLSEMSYAKYMK